MARVFEHIVTSLVTLALVAAGLWIGGPKLVRAWSAGHDQAAVDHSTVGTQAAALSASAVAAGQANTACLRSSSASYRAGLAAARLIDNPPPAPLGQHPTVDGAGLMSLIGGDQ